MCHALRDKCLLFLCVLAALVCWGGAGQAGQDAETARPTLLVVVNGAPPYRIIQHEGGSTLFSGYYVDIIREAADRAGVSLLFREVPFLRGLRMMEFGRADMMLGPNRTPERERYMDYLDVALPREAKVFYLRPGLADLKGYDDLTGRLIGVLPGALYFPQFDADNTIRRQLIPSYSSGLEMTERSRVDAVIMPELLGAYLVRLKELHLAKASYRIPGRPSYIVISKKSPAVKLKDRLEEALEGMVADGTMDRINTRYR